MSCRVWLRGVPRHHSAQAPSVTQECRCLCTATRIYVTYTHAWMPQQDSDIQSTKIHGAARSISCRRIYNASTTDAAASGGAGMGPATRTSTASVVVAWGCLSANAYSLWCTQNLHPRTPGRGGACHTPAPVHQRKQPKAADNPANAAALKCARMQKQARDSRPRKVLRRGGGGGRRPERARRRRRLERVHEHRGAEARERVLDRGAVPRSDRQHV